MSVSLVGGLPAANPSSASDVTAIAMLKKALQVQEQSAAQLLQALPSLPPANPPHLGQHLDVTA